MTAQIINLDKYRIQHNNMAGHNHDLPKQAAKVRQFPLKKRAAKIDLNSFCYSRASGVLFLTGKKKTISQNGHSLISLHQGMILNYFLNGNITTSYIWLSKHKLSFSHRAINQFLSKHPKISWKLYPYNNKQKLSLKKIVTPLSNAS